MPMFSRPRKKLELKAWQMKPAGAIDVVETIRGAIARRFARDSAVEWW